MVFNVATTTRILFNTSGPHGPSRDLATLPGPLLDLREKARQTGPGGGPRAQRDLRWPTGLSKNKASSLQGGAGGRAPPSSDEHE